MTDPVETLVDALWDAYTRSMHDFAPEAVARALLGQIAPALVAEAVAQEREECARTAEEYMDGEGPAAAIRSRGQG